MVDQMGHPGTAPPQEPQGSEVPGKGQRGVEGWLLRRHRQQRRDHSKAGTCSGLRLPTGGSGTLGQKQ